MRTFTHDGTLELQRQEAKLLPLTPPSLQAESVAAILTTHILAPADGDGKKYFA